MAGMRCPNCGRKLEERVAAGKTVRCSKCGESLRSLARNEQSQGWDKLAKLLEGGGLSPLGSSPAALSVLHQPSEAAPPAHASRSKADEAAKPTPIAEGVADDDRRVAAIEEAALQEVLAIGEDFKGVKEDLGRLEARLAALEALLRKR